MYLSFFGLNEKPFAITPDPRYLFMSERHAEALAHLVYGINEAGGFVQLTGEVGTGKTTIIRSLLAQAPRNAEVALVLNPRISAPEFLLTICEELGIGVPDSAVGSVKELVDILNRYLLRAHAEGKRVVLVVDEAQNLAPEVLEQVRLLTNLETETHKLLQIILIGQPELRDILARTELRQLAQRVTGRYHLAPLSPEQTRDYLRHRLRVAGATSDIFTTMALREAHRLSQGVPRLINVIADRALLGAYTQDKHQVTAALVHRAASEVFGRRIAPVWLPWALAGAATLAIVLGGIGIWQLRGRAPPSRPAAAVADTATGTADTTAGAAALHTAVAAVGSAAATNSAGMRNGIAAAGGTQSPGSANGLAFSEWLASLGANGVASAAFSELFSMWHVNYALHGADACVQAVRAGLSCLAQRGSLAQLQQYNRPALLTLNDMRGDNHDVVLARLGLETATLVAGNGSREVPVSELARTWFGDYIILWQPGSSGARRLAFGARGANVRALRGKLMQLAGRSARGRSSNFYDSELVQLVEDFQRHNHLAIDGIAGVQTLVVLDCAVASPGTPQLSFATPDTPKH